MSEGWQFFLDYQAWSDRHRLFIRHRDRQTTAFIAPFVATKVVDGSAYDTATLDETAREMADGIGDVTGFLQAALDCAWKRGLRPHGFADQANELTAVRYHLEDMRKLAKVRP